ncbi:hypothetical protein [Amycolatopsis sp. DSM 110486]|uniref:hypothetical protein n=1 Tax=Amycolatopsis sp. DSM 110486 TaxID=2865832 RepID=UPI001C6A1B32|nr:hypothetical protein [Amycolatopsis sp. DSM 110486]QYN21470.1 hypothetical protein K1T34_02630 [Amycolatopsis sp. DSM 110486]
MSTSKNRGGGAGESTTEHASWLGGSDHPEVVDRVAILNAVRPGSAVPGYAVVVA